MSNPFFEDWNTPYGIPPFDRIQNEHYLEAFERGFAEQNVEIDRITQNQAPANFTNTIEALERSGALLAKTGMVFSNLSSSDTNDSLQAIELALAPKYAAHEGRLLNNQALFERVKQVYSSLPEADLDADQVKLCEDAYTRFVRAGAALEEQARDQVMALDETLAELQTQFSQNLLKDTNEFELVIDATEDIAGLSQTTLQAAKAEAQQRGKTNSYVFTVSRSSITPLLQFADSRDLREKMYRAYIRNGANDNANNNQPLVSQIATLRLQRAQLLGYSSHAHYMLDDRMAKNPANVSELLGQIWQPTQKKVAQEAQDLQTMIQERGDNFELAPWDWWYYTEKLRSERYALDEDQIKPYFKLENVRDGAFDVAHRLFGLTFELVNDVPVYHPDVLSYQVKDADGSLIGLFLVDYFMRPTKQGGAWMSEFRAQSNLDASVRPIVVNCCNFPKSTPCLLTMDEVRILFHEFGHGLHGLLSQVRYESQSGTNVKQDFVELPSQIMEHWATEPSVLRNYARHVDTGETIPDVLIDKLLAADTFNQGFATTEYLAASYLDMAWSGLEAPTMLGVDEFEAKAMAAINLIDVVGPRYNSGYFQHIFAGDNYSAGYYAYIWAEVLDADGFEAFKENGIFDPATALSFRQNVLERGGTAEAMGLYQAFRGRAPAVEPLLRKRGLLTTSST